MAYTLKEIEYLHDTGKMPDWIYYQQNGKSATENYIRIKNEMRRKWREKLLMQRAEKEDLDEPFEVSIKSEVKVK